MKSVNLYIPLLLLLFLAGACGTKKSDGASGALSDDALLDTVQRRTFNYFWDGAEPNSGLARERIHMDGVYPENDQNVVTSGGSGFGNTVKELKPSAPGAEIVEGKLLNRASRQEIADWVKSL